MTVTEVVQVGAGMADDPALRPRIERHQCGRRAGQDRRIGDRDPDPGKRPQQTEQHLTEHYASARSPFCSSSPGNSLRVLTRYIARSAGTPSCLGENTCLRIRLADRPSASKSSAGIRSIVDCDTIKPPRAARSITRAAMLTSTPSQSEPIRCGLPV